MLLEPWQIRLLMVIFVLLINLALAIIIVNFLFFFFEIDFFLKINENKLKLYVITWFFFEMCRRWWCSCVWSEWRVCFRRENVFVRTQKKTTLIETIFFKKTIFFSLTAHHNQHQSSQQHQHHNQHLNQHLNRRPNRLRSLPPCRRRLSS